MLSTHSLLEHMGVFVLLDNKTISDICRRSLDIESPTQQACFSGTLFVILIFLYRYRFLLSFSADVNLHSNANKKYAALSLVFPADVKLHFNATSFINGVSAFCRLLM